MEQRTIGGSAAKVPPIILGGNVFGWGVDESTSGTLLDAAVGQGLNCIDTADIYSYWASGNHGGESEAIIGRWLTRRGRRDDVIIHTKGGAPGAPGEFSNARLTADYLTKAVEGSLRRLATDYIDLYYVHYDDRVTPPEETLAALQALVKQGKLRAIAASNYEPARLRAALEAGKSCGEDGYVGLQTHYNLYDRAGYEQDIEPICLEHGIGVMSYFSLASGFLTGKYRSAADLGKSAARGAGMASLLNPRGLRILAALDAVAERHDATPARIALAWLLSRPSLTAAIASATSLAQLDDLVAATHITLDAAALALLETGSAPEAA